MEGFWWIPTTTIDPGLGGVIFEGAVAGLVIICTVFSLGFHPKDFSERRTLHAGLVLLSFWLLLHWIDLVVRHQRPTLNYNYILFDTTNKCFRVTSDVLLIFGMWRVMIRYYHLRPLSPGSQIRNFVLGVNVLATIMWALAVYQLCLTFATALSWLSFNDLGVIESIARARSGFEVTSAALFFVIALLTITIAKRIKFLDNSILGYGTDLTRTIALSSNPGDSLYPAERQAISVASWGLLLRQFCEVVIAGQLNRQPSHLGTIYLARDVTYSLFSAGVCICLAFTIPYSSKKPDPLVALDILAVAAAKSALEQIVQRASESGKKTAPSLGNALYEVETAVKASQRVALAARRPLDSLELSMKMMELVRLRKLYADWEPVCKSQPGTVLFDERVSGKKSPLSQLIAKNDGTW